MEATVPVIHYFDTLAHRTLCGAGVDQRSTKHERGVTCQACVRLLSERRAASEAASGVGV